MECPDCNKEMDFVDVFDTGSNGHDKYEADVAYNLHVCHYCGCIFKDNVWDYDKICITADNTITRFENQD